MGNNAKVRIKSFHAPFETGGNVTDVAKLDFLRTISILNNGAKSYNVAFKFKFNSETGPSYEK